MHGITRSYNTSWLPNTPGSSERWLQAAGDIKQVSAPEKKTHQISYWTLIYIKNICSFQEESGIIKQFSALPFTSFINLSVILLLISCWSCESNKSNKLPADPKYPQRVKIWTVWWPVHVWAGCLMLYHNQAQWILALSPWDMPSGQKKHLLMEVYSSSRMT